MKQRTSRMTIPTRRSTLAALFASLSVAALANTAMAQQTSGIGTQVAFDVPISINCSKSLIFGEIQLLKVTAMGQAGANTKVIMVDPLQPNGSAYSGLMIDEGIVSASGGSPGECTITGATGDMAIDVDLGGGGNFACMDGDNGITLCPILTAVNSSGASFGLTGGEPFGVDLKDIDVTNLNNAAETAGAYSFVNGVFTFKVGGMLHADTLHLVMEQNDPAGENVAKASTLEGVYNGTATITVSL